MSAQSTSSASLVSAPTDEATVIAQSMADITAEQLLLDVAHARQDQVRASSQQLILAIEVEKTAEALAFERIKAEGKAAAEALRHDRLERQVAQAIEDRIAAELALTQAAQENQRAQAQAARELELQIENDARVLEAVRVRMEAEYAATRAEREKLEAEAEATQHNKVRIEAERKADGAAQERLKAMEDLQKEIAMQRETARQADAQRQLRLQVEWQAFRGSLRVMGRYWLAGMSVLLVALGSGLGVFMASVSVNTTVLENTAEPLVSAHGTLPPMERREGAALDPPSSSSSSSTSLSLSPSSAADASPATSTPYSAALYEGKESDRLADMPSGMRLDEDFAVAGSSKP